MQKDFTPSEATDGRDASDGDARVRFKLRLVVRGGATEPVLSMDSEKPGCLGELRCWEKGGFGWALVDGLCKAAVQSARSKS